jgi:hypothetical protein
VSRGLWSIQAGWPAAAALALLPATGRAQVAPAAAQQSPDDAPSVRVGGTLFVDYTHTRSPKVADADGNRVSQSAFNVGRAYLNVTGQLNHIFAFRITPDIVRETGSGSSITGSLDFRLKYGYLQVNLDDWMPRGTYARIGMIQTPYVDFEDNVYRYRFQGTTFADREGFEPSSDFGASFRTAFPSDYGEVVVGLYNGDGYTRADPNGEKALRIRGTVRPFPRGGVWRGLRLTGHTTRDHYVKDGERHRYVGTATFEHTFINAAIVVLKARDQTSARVAEVDSDGLSVWATPKTRRGIEGLFRYDRLAATATPADTRKERVIAGVAYWPPMKGSSVTTAFLLDVEQVTYTDFAPARPTEKRVAVHMLVNF